MGISLLIIGAVVAFFIVAIRAYNRRVKIMASQDRETIDEFVAQIRDLNKSLQSPYAGSSRRD